MHPVLRDDMAAQRQCELYGEARVAGGPAHLKGSKGGRIRRALSGRRRERDLRTVEPGC